MDNITKTIKDFDLEASDLEYSEDDDSDLEYYVGAEDNEHALKSISRPQCPQPNQQKGKPSTFQPNEGLWQKYSHKISIENYISSRLPSAQKFFDQEGRNKVARVKDKESRATMEQVLDPRTRGILFKMLNKRIMSEIQGCISTGKEANVYYAPTESGLERAVKIYKTSILTFKDRDKYVSGDYRFKHGYCRKNPRKMVRTWAEKEMRNLSRIHSSGLPCPKPIILKSHVLVMEFVGKEGWPAPLLKESNVDEEEYGSLYIQCVSLIRDLYHKCKLIHADLSEYNLLYMDGKAIIIDVSQSVEHDHPHALEFLRKDCTNITEYFRRNGVSVMTVRQLFDFVTSSYEDLDVKKYVEDRVAENIKKGVTEEAKVDEEVFKQAFIPKRLDEVIDAERDVFSPEKNDTTYQTLTGPKSGENMESNSSGDSSSDASSDSEDECQEKAFSSSARPREESPNSKKERKKALRDARREKQKTKIPKHIKKRKERLGRESRKIKK
ncbi:serine/threonine-protein kinase RIO1 [Parasteatoda tepidariorum]|uniref:serine/threonine-protein kinase RIO1 n=1 Tax=Parasteatoda tepidariorum TaxID=114398 RepID=UPI00077FA60E|nr:serine/threonine-protein kinase RIO1 [Parasteatoda tepidariorum]